VIFIEAHQRNIGVQPSHQIIAPGVKCLMIYGPAIGRKKILSISARLDLFNEHLVLRRNPNYP
jgi:hypothetical protein